MWVKSDRGRNDGGGGGGIAIKTAVIVASLLERKSRSSPGAPTCSRSPVLTSECFFFSFFFSSQSMAKCPAYGKRMITIMDE